MRPRTGHALRFLCRPERRSGIGPGLQAGRRVVHRTLRADVCPALQGGHSDEVIAVFLGAATYLKVAKGAGRGVFRSLLGWIAFSSEWPRPRWHIGALFTSLHWWELIKSGSAGAHPTCSKSSSEVWNVSLLTGNLLNWYISLSVSLCGRRGTWLQVSCELQVWTSHCCFWNQVLFQSDVCLPRKKIGEHYHSQ